MPLEICRNDITHIKADVIVDPTDCFLSGSGGTDAQIHRCAGEELDKKCREIGSIQVGEVAAMPSYNCSNCSHIFMTCGPIYIDGKQNEREDLRNCYANCLNKAVELKAKSIAFPLISSGTFSFPKGEALSIATDVIASFLIENELMVYLLVYDKEAFDLSNRIFTGVKDYIGKHLELPECFECSEPLAKQSEPAIFEERSFISTPSRKKKATLNDSIWREEFYVAEKAVAPSFVPDESFSEYLLRTIDEKGLKDSEVYKKANVDRKLFSKIRNNINYRPKKETAVAFAIALKLNLNETNKLLEKAGFVLSKSSVFDLVILYCIENEIYQIYKVNELLFENDQKTLGC